MKRKAFFRHISIVLMFCLLLSCVAIPVSSEETIVVGQSTIQNGSFEYPNLKGADTSNKGWANIKYGDTAYETSQLSWKTTANDENIEYGWLTNNNTTSPHMVPTTVTEIKNGVGASDGMKFSELIANSPNSSIFQSLELTADRSYDFTIHHRGRKGEDTTALFLTKDTEIDYTQPDKGKDHFALIIEWMKTQTQSVTIPAVNKMAHYTVYTTELLENSVFEESSTGSCFSFKRTDDHTVKFEVWFMTSPTKDWGEHTDKFVPDSDGKYLFVLSPVISKGNANNSNSGNLVDNLSFSYSGGANMLKNPGFESYNFTSTYYQASAANHATPTANIGWSSTSSDHKVELGNLEAGDAYGLDGLTVEIKKYNTPSVREGEQFAELNANEESSLYQIVDTDPGKMYRWGLSHRGRSGKDTMALIIGPNQDNAPKKTTKTARDQLMQMVDWLYSQTDVALDIPETGCSNEIKLYTSKFDNDGGFSGNNISWRSDNQHTEEWSIWIISSLNDDWHDYGDIENGAAYNYNYIVPMGQQKTIFGFVSVNAVNASGREDKTYGNLLDNINFEEFYYVNADFDKKPTSEYGTVNIIPAVDGTFEPDDDTNDTGWVIKGSNITVNYHAGTRKFLGGYINGVFYPYDSSDPNCKWKYDGEKKIYYCTFEKVNSSITVKIIYEANNVIYDSCNPDHPYQYDLNDPESGYEVPLDGIFNEYISHEPTADDGWKFMGWQYILTHEIESGIKSYTLDAVHKVQYYTVGENEFLRIYRKLPGEKWEEVVGNIPESNGITFFAQWQYRQRAVSKTFNSETREYDLSTKGGTVDVGIIYGKDMDAINQTIQNYVQNDTVVGEELYCYSEDTYVQVMATNKDGYKFGGWYNSSGLLVSRNPSYSYKVGNNPTELFAYFEPLGYSITLKSTIAGASGSSDKFFAVDCKFTGLLANGLYAISGAPTGNILINGTTVTNPTSIIADPDGKATVKIYVNHNSSVKFLHLKANCLYSIEVDKDSKDGFSVMGEMTNQSLTANTIAHLIFYKANQSVYLSHGKYYAGIPQKDHYNEITITPQSSFTFETHTTYTPNIYNSLSAELCFFDENGNDKNFPKNTRILMIDTTDNNNPRYYQKEIINEQTAIKLSTFLQLGTANTYYELRTSESEITENLLFIVDYFNSINTTTGKIALIYNDGSNNLKTALSPDRKLIKIDVDTTSFAATPEGNGNAVKEGPFVIGLSIKDSTPAVNTTYQANENGKYAVKLSLDGGTLPNGSYAVVDGDTNKTYYSNNGLITISPLLRGDHSISIYLPTSLANIGETVTFNADLLSAVTAYPNLQAKNDKPQFTLSEYSIDAEVSNKVLSPGYISEINGTLKYQGINEIKLTIREKNSNGTYTQKLTDVNVSLLENDRFTVNLSNAFNVESGKTYIFSFVGYVNGAPVLEDKCTVVGGYISQ